MELIQLIAQAKKEGITLDVDEISLACHEIRNDAKVCAALAFIKKSREDGKKASEILGLG